MKNIVTNIQRFCLHDGPGIRTTIFFKGCNLRCPWCSNPENLSFDIEKSIDGNIIYGKEFTCEQLYEEIIKDRIYYENNGGVTFSGGEPLWHFKDIEDLLKKLNKEYITIAVETSATLPIEYIKFAEKYVDYFLIDIKILTDDAYLKINSNTNIFVENIEYLIRKKSNIKFRLPLVKNFTYSEENLNKVYAFLKKYNIEEIEIFNIHGFGKNKYNQLGKKFEHFDKLSEKELEEIIKKFKGINITILNI